MFYLLIIIKVM